MYLLLNTSYKIDMNFNDLIVGIKNYGVTSDDICTHVLGVSSIQIQKTVVIAPSWEATALPNLGESELVSSSEVLFSSIKVWNVKYNNLEFSYIKTGFGAPLLMDALLALGLTKCKRIIFIGSAGALDSQMNVGDIAIPISSICGDGASRYIASNKIIGNDVFGEKCVPNSTLLKQLIAITEKASKESHAQYHIVNAFSSDTIFAQFVHLETIMSMGCDVIEMETAVAFRASELLKIPIVALLSLSDNAVKSKSLMSGRKDYNKDYYRFVKKQLIPQIILKLISTEGDG